MDIKMNTREVTQMGYRKSEECMRGIGACTVTTSIGEVVIEEEDDGTLHISASDAFTTIEQSESMGKLGCAFGN